MARDEGTDLSGLRSAHRSLLPLGLRYRQVGRYSSRPHQEAFKERGNALKYEATTTDAVAQAERRAVANQYASRARMRAV